MSSYNEKIKKTFQDTSKTIYELMEVVDPKIKQIHEDGISSIILKNISRLRQNGLHVKTQSLDVYEGKTGIDYHLWIGENDNRYLRFIVQAKSFGNYTDINDSYTYTKKYQQQCETIIEEAKKGEKAFPLYFLYQHINDDSSLHNCFSFLDDFEPPFSGVTVTSAYNMLEHYKSKDLKFSDIHQNTFNKIWKNDIYEVFQNFGKEIGLPLYLLHDISPTSIDRFNKLISDKENSLKLLFLLLFPENFQFEPLEITMEGIIKRYGENQKDCEIQYKNLIIIDDKNKGRREKIKNLNRIFNSDCKESNKKT